MALGLTKALNGLVRNCQVHLPGGGARVRGRQSELMEQVLRDPMVTAVLFKTREPPGGGPGLSPVADYEPERFERCQMLERRGRTDRELRSDPSKRSPVTFNLELSNGD
jgi:hypothetical protein